MFFKTNRLSFIPWLFYSVQCRKWKGNLKVHVCQRVLGSSLCILQSPNCFLFPFFSKSLSEYSLWNWFPLFIEMWGKHHTKGMIMKGERKKNSVLLSHLCRYIWFCNSSWKLECISETENCFHCGIAFKIHTGEVSSMYCAWQGFNTEQLAWEHTCLGSFLCSIHRV